MSNRPPAKFVRYQLLGIIVAIGLNLMLMVLPVRAIDRADIVVDGRPLFKVSGAESLTASERADLLNLRLQQIQKSATPIQISIESRNQSPIILVNDRQLLTVTQSDVLPPLTPTTQANLWTQQLSQALQQAQQEKGTGFLKTAIPIALGTLAVAIVLHYVLGWLWRSTRSVLQRLVESSPTLQVTRIGTGSQDAVAAIVKYLLIILGTIAILQVWGIDRLDRVLNHKLALSSENQA